VDLKVNEMQTENKQNVNARRTSPVDRKIVHEAKDSDALIPHNHLSCFRVTDFTFNLVLFSLLVF
jgi:hypothetical protein